MAAFWLGLVMFLHVASGTPRKCDMNSNTCIYLEDRNVSSFEEAKNVCEEKNHKLLSIPDKNMHRVVGNYVKKILKLQNKNFFIDLKRKDLTNYISVVKGNPLKSETSDGNFLIKSDKIFSKESGFKAGYICQINGTCPESDGSYIQREELCFKKNKHQVTWYEARNDCIENEGDLTDEIDHIDNGSMYWLGYSKISWYVGQDLNKSFTKFTNWRDNYEDTHQNDDQHCVMVGPDFTWQPSPCSVNKQVSVICMSHADSYHDVPKRGMPSYLIIIFVIIASISIMAVIMAVVIPILSSRRKKFSFLRGIENEPIERKMIFQDV